MSQPLGLIMLVTFATLLLQIHSLLLSLEHNVAHVVVIVIVAINKTQMPVIATSPYRVLKWVGSPSVLWHCWLGCRKGIRPVKTEWWGAGVVICLERCADLHTAQLMPLPLTVSCFSKIQIGFTFLVPADPGSPGQRAVKRVCVCVCVCVYLILPSTWVLRQSTIQARRISAGR